MTTCLTVEVGPTEVEGETRILRSSLSPEELITGPTSDVKTLYDLIQYSAKVRPNLDAVGYRKILKVIEEDKEVTKMVAGSPVKETKRWKYFKLSGYKWMTYMDVKITTGNIGAGLRHLGVQPKDRITVFGATR